MKHFVAYHNPLKMGRSLRDSNALRVLTNKPVDRMPGGKVWFITRDESAEQPYVLGSVFEVNDVGEAESAEFAHFASGTGHEFDPPAPLGNEEWFPEFLRVMANFSFGVTEVKDPRVIDALKAFAKRAGKEVE